MAVKSDGKHRLTSEQKIFVVEALARYHTPTEVQELIFEAHGFTLGLSSIQRYDPTVGQGSALSQKLRDRFEAARKRFNEDVESLPIASRSFRLRELLNLYVRAKQDQRDTDAAALLAQAAREVGNAYTNSRVLGGNLGLFDLHELSDGQLQRIADGEDPRAVVASASLGAS